mmetsp:Transcript_4295/g.10485  ORF Transcript_4295/g.10485 Transcript_4295/m.10485 type:complete len:103 (-) Transcript_4295:766-1074(-)|eukprot:g6264.t1
MFLRCVAFLFSASVMAKEIEPTSEQKAEYMRDFDEFDSNKDSFLDTQEVRGNFKGEVADPELWEFYKMADKNLDGKVSKEEYIKYAADLSYSSESSDTKQEV